MGAPVPERNASALPRLKSPSHSSPADGQTAAGVGRPPVARQWPGREGYLVSSLPAHCMSPGLGTGVWGLTLTSPATPGLPVLLRRLSGKGVGVGLGAQLGTRLGVRERAWASQYSEGAAELPGLSRRSSRLWLPRSG